MTKDSDLTNSFSSYIHLTPYIQPYKFLSAQAEAAAPSAEAVPGAEEGAKKEEPKEENPGDKDELWMHKWGFGPMETIQSEAFYRMIGRTGITYGDTFRMVKRVASSDAAAMMRCAALLCPRSDAQKVALCE